MDVSELKQVVKLFIQDVDEALAQFDASVAALASEGVSHPEIDRLVRTTQRMKGSAAALGFAEISEFTHHIERYLRSLKTHEQIPLTEACKPLISAKDFLHNHVQSLRDNKKSPGAGEHIVRDMDKVLEPKPFARIIQLPRAPLAGDIWFMNEDLKLELFEMPEEPPAPDEPIADKTTDPEHFAIQAEILRLTQLAAAVNLSTVLAAQSTPTRLQTSELSPEWSLAGVALKTPVIDSNQQPAATNDAGAPVESELEVQPASNDGTQSSLEPVSDERVDQHEEILDSQALQAVVQGMTEPDDNDADQPERTGDLAQNTNLKSAPNHPTADSSVHSQRTAVSQPTPIQQSSYNSKDSIKVSLSDIDELLKYTEELVTLQNIIDEHKPLFETPLMQKSISRLSKLIAMTQELSMSMKMVRFDSLSGTIDSHVQELSLSLQKDITAELEGGDLEIDKSILDDIADPISLLIRNAVEHGIESAEERVAKGKTAAGRVTVSLKVTAKEIIFEVTDDGGGIDIAHIRKRAIACGLMARLDRLSDDEIRSFIFHQGFSTRASDHDDDDTAGYGLHTVSTFVQSKRGRIEINSIRDHGTVFRIVLPQMISVIEAFVVRVGSERFVIPKNQVTENVSSQEAHVDIMQGGNQLLNLRGTSVPLIHLSTVLRRPAGHRTSDALYEGIALVVQQEHARPYAVIVDDIICQKKIVMKPLGRELQGLIGLTGAAILGDGQPAIILDLHDLVESYRSGKMSAFNRKSA